MADRPEYYDLRSDFWRRHFAIALDYDAYLAVSDPDKAKKWEVMAAKIPPLTSEQAARLQGHNRKLHVLFYSGVWCGDCVRQGPMLCTIARACGSAIDLRFIDREASAELKDELRILGAEKVPVAVFLSEDFLEVGRFGDRLLTVYRRKARRELGAVCDPGIVAPSIEEMAAEQEEWVCIFERMLLMLRLSPLLRTRYGD